MKRLMLSALLLALTAVGCSGGSQERIKRFHVQLTAQADRTLSVDEELDVEVAGKVIKRGVYREILLDSQGQSHELSNIKTWRDGVAVPHILEKVGPRARIRIIAPTTLTHGTHVFRIKYDIAGRIEEDETHRRLIWNATGMRWAFPVENISVSLRTDATVAAEVKAEARRKNDAASTVAPTRDEEVLRFRADGACQPGDSFLVNARWPKPTPNEKEVETSD